MDDRTLQAPLPSGPPARPPVRRSRSALARRAAPLVLVAMLAAGCAQGATQTANPPATIFPTPLPPGLGPVTPEPSAAPPSPSASPGTSAPPAPSAQPGSTISADDAVALVLATDPRFAGLKPRDLGVIGQAAWYEVRPDGTGYVVTITFGWGDCPAGCIYRHTWTYAVSGGGDVRLVSESGDDAPPADGA